MYEACLTVCLPVSLLPICPNFGYKYRQEMSQNIYAPFSSELFIKILLRRFCLSEVKNVLRPLSQQHLSSWGLTLLFSASRRSISVSSMTPRSLLLSVLVLLAFFSTACCSPITCNNQCCRFVEAFPGRLKKLREDYSQIRDFYVSKSTTLQHLDS